MRNRSGLRLDFRVKNGIEDRTYHAEDGEIVPFSFETRHIKKRHRKTLSEGQLRRHQVCVKIEGWKETLPISVDRVGVYFRYFFKLLLYFIDKIFSFFVDKIFVKNVMFNFFLDM